MVEELSKSLQSATGKLYAVKCDVSKDSDIETAFKWIKDNLGGVDILVNNAATAPKNHLIDGSPEDFRIIMDTNVIGLSVCTQQALKSMKERGVDDGHVIHINSIAGHLPPFEGLRMYGASKHAVTVLTEGLRQELVKQKSNIRVTSISPGLVETKMPPQEYLKKSPYLQPEDIAAGVLYVLGAPPHVQVHELTIIPVGQNL
jgi:NADP+-dependent farnesol dehydrogenase